MKKNYAAFWNLLYHTTHEELAPKILWLHIRSVFQEAHLVWGELHPFCKQSQQKTFMEVCIKVFKKEFYWTSNRQGICIVWGSGITIVSPTVGQWLWFLGWTEVKGKIEWNKTDGGKILNRIGQGNIAGNQVNQASWCGSQVNPVENLAS